MQIMMSALKETDKVECYMVNRRGKLTQNQ